MTKHVALGLAALCAFGAARAQEPVVAAADPETLFTDSDPGKHANKQVVLHILRELLQCNYWDQADRWLTERYLQHNPNVTSGRDKPGAKYTSICYDQWRIVDGRADEHWDTATLGPPVSAQ